MSIQSDSFQEEKESGRISQSHKDYIEAFKEYGPMTSREAREEVHRRTGRMYPPRNGRISELEQMGFIERHSVVMDQVTNKRVNTWRATNRTTPLPCQFKWVECKYCEGHGGKYRRAYIQESADAKQLEMF
jgi:t-SNARE complex subunit (syntaxin)